MKNKLYVAILMVILAMVALSCKKDPAVNIESFEITRENLNVGGSVATITGTYSYAGVIDGIETCVSEMETGLNVGAFPATLDGNGFSVEISGLSVGTTYSYYYSVDYGVSKPYTTESKIFTTITESPTVQTLEVLALDSTTFRVKCEVLSDGGQEVTERGICYNTYGDPTMDDATLQHASGGLGQYTVRMENLALGKKYYVRAYAKNAVGVGLGEEMEFETPAPPGMPVSIVLSCDPEEGGSVSGGGTYPVGSQCTVTATANAGYTFVNWTENGNQVSTDATYTFNVTRECNLVANFTAQAYVITAEVTPDNSGTVTGAGGYNHGEECTLTATAKPGYEFVKWTKNGIAVSTNASITFAVTESATYVAHFQTKSYTVTVSAQPSNGGLVTGGGTFNYGQSCAVHATPAEGCNFINWTDDGDVVSTDANYSFTVTSNRTLVAHFTSNGGGGHDYVDLGLPSGTLWATCNVGANAPYDYGDYFAWGETQPKAVYDWNTYLYSNGDYNQLTKYCSLSDFGYNGYTDGLTVLLPEDDAATANWGNDWHTPTKVEWMELLNNTTQIWTTQNDVYGRIFTATNGNSIFLPSAGMLWASSSDYFGSRGYYWSSSLGPGYPTFSWMLFFDSDGCQFSDYDRYCGRSVRPVRSGSNPQSYLISVFASPSSGGNVSGGGTYQQGQSCTVTATAATGYTFLRWTENGTQVSTNANYTFTVSSNRTLVAQFQAQSFTISVSASPSSGGSVTGGGTYQQGQSCTVSASANSGFSFTNWTENGNVVSNNANYTFTVSNSRALIANFIVQSGNFATDFSAVDCHGTQIHLFDILDGGQAVLIEFFSSTMGICQQTTPKVVESYYAMGCNLHEVFYIGVSINDSESQCQNWCQDFGIEYPVISGAAGGATICNHYNIEAYPTVMLIMPNHQIVIQELWPITNAQTIITALESYGIEQHECGKSAKDD